MTATTPARASVGALETEPDPGRARAFSTWAGGAFLVVTGALLALGLRRSDGHLVYLIDDPAIHLTVAGNLARHGTWGVVPGQFQSASSSPLWTLVLAAALRIAGPLETALPLLINLVAGLWVVALIGRHQRALRPSFRRPADVVATVALVVGVLFLPGLALLGMEHTLHVALVLAACLLLTAPERPAGWRAVLPWVLLGLATLARFETLFVAAGLGVAVLAAPIGDAPALPRRFGRAALIGAVAGGPFALFAVFNHAMGQGWLPNSVLAKGQAINGAGAGFGPGDLIGRLSRDPVILVVVAVLGGYVIVRWADRSRTRHLALAVVVATVLHATFASIGWFDRYQAYLVALGAVVLLDIAADGLSSPAPGPAPARARSLAVPLLVLVALFVAGGKVDLLRRVPTGVADTYQQRYQAGRFFQRYYDGQPIATSELGYISLFHDGPITDLYGLGDYEVLQARREQNQRPGPAYWEGLTATRGFRVAAVYPTTLYETTPESWILVGEIHLDHDSITAWEPTFQFWATDPDEVAPLEAHLRDFERELPAGVRLTMNELAGFRADAVKKARTGR